jgi:hypothetical protein
MPCRGGLQNCTPAMFLSTVDAPIAVRWSSVACHGSVLNSAPCDGRPGCASRRDLATLVSAYVVYCY